MNEVPIGIRRTEDGQALRQKSTDPALVLDRVSPAIEGYFRLPAVWIGDEPPQESVLNLDAQVHHEFVLTATLKCGVEVRVQRDGTFWFDFATWPLAPQVEIPGFRLPDPSGPYRVPRLTEQAEERAEDYAVVRAKVMNVHQACLTSSETIVARRSAMMGFPVTAWNTEKAISWRGLPGYRDRIEDLHALARNILNNSYGIQRDRPLPRRVIELDVVEHSLCLLDRVLLLGDLKLIQLFETIFMAACRSRDKRFGEALTLGWNVCEQIVFQMWNKFLDETNGKCNGNRVSRERRNKLTGRDYTASTVVEILELIGVLDQQTYRNLDVCRRARNAWTHELKTPKENEVHTCIRTGQDLMLRHFGVQLHLQAGGSGGVPQWPVWMWEQVLREGRGSR